MRQAYHGDRVKRLQARLVEAGLGGFLVSQPDSVYYLTGFFHYPSERPILAWVPDAGNITLAVPLLEADHADGVVDDVIVYDEFPGSPDAWDTVMDAYRARGLGRGAVGYEGSLAAAYVERLRRIALVLTQASDHIQALRMSKGPEEIALLRKAGEYSVRMVAEGIRWILERGPTVREVEVVEHVTEHVIGLIAEAGDDLVFVQSVGGGLVCFGDHSSLPHALPSLRQLGDASVVLLSLGCMVGGYAAECERTFFLNRPTDDQRYVHEAVQEAQEVGFRALRVGTPCEQADQVARAVLVERGFGPYIRHRLGHGMGLRFHEPPWVAPGDRTPMPPYAVVSCEPGLYLPGRFGVRIADTVLVTEEGPERLTDDPSGWEVPTIR